MNRNLLIIGAIGLGVAYFMMSKNGYGSTQGNEDYYLIGNEAVKESELNSRGYYYWANGANGAGFYSIHNFSNVFNIPQAQFESIIAKGLQDTQSNDPAMVQVAEQVLNQYLMPGSVPLPKIPAGALV